MSETITGDQKMHGSVLGPHPSLLSPQSSSLIPDNFAEVTANLLRQGHSVRFRATGQSMHPTIRDGEEITVEPVAPREVKRGDILLYRGAKGVIAHRVVDIETDSRRQSAISQPSAVSSQSSSLSPHYLFILRGDASSSCDQPVAPAQVLGRVISVSRNGRDIVLNSARAKLEHSMYVYTFRLARLSGVGKIYRLINRTLEQRRAGSWIKSQR